MKSSSSELALRSGLELFSREYSSWCFFVFDPNNGGEVPCDRALKVCRNDRFFAVSNDRASAMTPLGPVLAWKAEVSGMSTFDDSLGRGAGGGEALFECRVVLPLEGVEEREASSGCTVVLGAFAASKAANSSRAVFVMITLTLSRTNSDSGRCEHAVDCSGF